MAKNYEFLSYDKEKLIADIKFLEEDTPNRIPSNWLNPTLAELLDLHRKFQNKVIPK